MKEGVSLFFTGVKMLAQILGFLFFSPWGWAILGLFVGAILLKQGISGDGKWRWHVFLLNTSELITKLFLFLPQIGMSLLLLFSFAIFEKDIRTFYENLRLAREKELLTLTLKNLHFEGKLLEIRVTQLTNSYQLLLSYFTHSPWQKKPLLRQTQTLLTTDKRVYIDFGVCNFDYSLIGDGRAYNLAFPYRLYTASQAPEKGFSLFSGDNNLLWVFDIPSEELVGMEREDFTAMGRKIVIAITNKDLARKLGIRTFYGEAIAIDLIHGGIYQFFTTGTGGIKLYP